MLAGQFGTEGQNYMIIFMFINKKWTKILRDFNFSLLPIAGNSYRYSVQNTEQDIDLLTRRDQDCELRFDYLKRGGDSLLHQISLNLFILEDCLSICGALYVLYFIVN